MSTHQQLLYHVVFSTKGRRQLLKNDSFRNDVFAYMSAICSHNGGHAIIIGGYYDHAHLLVRIPAKQDVASFIGVVKASSSKNINDNTSSLMKFGWQEGYGAFSVSMSQVPRVLEYIKRQPEHHRKLTFQEEYLTLLGKHEVEYDPKYLWD
jgi:REP element-mobilizing transposase RayT